MKVAKPPGHVVAFVGAVVIGKEVIVTVAVAGVPHVGVLVTV